MSIHTIMKLTVTRNIEELFKFGCFLVKYEQIKGKERATVYGYFDKLGIDPVHFNKIVVGKNTIKYEFISKQFRLFLH